MTIRHRTIEIDGLDIFYREAGDPSAPTFVLLHGFPSSSMMYRDLIRSLSGQFHLIAPDYPGFGHSSAPSPRDWDYTFDRLADVVERLLTSLGVSKYAVYVHDYGAPVGFRLAVRHPERITGIVTQNGNAYEEGLTPLWEALRGYWSDPSPENAEPVRGGYTREAIEWQYTHGEPDPSLIDPDYALMDHALISRPGNEEIQLALFRDYGSNLERYPQWQEYLRTHQPPLLAVWGRNDEIFDPKGALAFARDVKDARIRLLDAGHFALHTHGEEIAGLVREFLRFPSANGRESS